MIRTRTARDGVNEARVPEAVEQVPVLVPVLVLVRAIVARVQLWEQELHVTQTRALNDHRRQAQELVQLDPTLRVVVVGDVDGVVLVVIALLRRLRQQRLHRRV